MFKFLPLVFVSILFVGSGCSGSLIEKGAPAALSSVHRFIVENEIDPALRYRVNIRYPEFSPPNQKARKGVARLNETVAAHVQKQQQDFIQEVRATFVKKNIVPSAQSFLEGTYRIDLATTHAVSLRFEGSSSIAATPSSDDVVIFNYDVVRGRPFSLADLFVPKSAYLATISDLARTELRSAVGSREDYAALDFAAGPEEKNFSRFFLSQDGLGLIFSPEQLALYGGGYQTIVIPWEQLAAILDPKGPAGGLVR